ncbi:glutathione S-transferase LANCL1-like [Convolutriloba macropyga]|uniref:glutathione S-transferase LANCL1-like n=1 Tax=Convolutriloba macropyga TaxID=536237 RepID=UPI003F5231BB
MAHHRRSFQNRLDTRAPYDQARLSQQLNSVLRYVLAGPMELSGSLYTGSSGIAYMLGHVGGSGVLRQAATAHSGSSAGPTSTVALLPCPSDLFAYGNTYLQMARSQFSGMRQRHEESLLCGKAGMHLTAAMLSSAETPPPAGSEETTTQHVRRYLSLRSSAVSCEASELLYGQAGWIFGALLLNKRFGDETVPPSVILTVVEATLENGRMMSSELGIDCPLFYTWHDRPYLGAAHGLMGICYVLLHVLEKGWAVEGLESDLRGMLRYVLSLELKADDYGVETASGSPDGMYPTAVGDGAGREPLIHWCHGSTGAVFLFCKAYQVLGRQEYLEAARRAGAVVWRSGLLTKGPGLCHGVAGNGYSLLTLYRCTGEQAYFQQALQFGYFLGTEEFLHGSRTPDCPHSLFEGWAGAACFLCDLMQPMAARFPLFELQ